MILNLLFAFITSAAIAVSFRGPLRAIPGAGLAGMLGYAAFHGTAWLGAPQMLSAFLGAVMVGLTGEVLARRLREPVILFVIPGLFPLVPGLMAYRGMLMLASEELGGAGLMLARMLFYAGALAAGLALPPVLLRGRRRTISVE